MLKIEKQCGYPTQVKCLRANDPEVVHVFLGI